MALIHQLGWLFTAIALWPVPAAVGLSVRGTTTPAPTSNSTPTPSEPQELQPQEQQPQEQPQPEEQGLKEPVELLVILEGKPLKDHNLEAIGQLISSGRVQLTVFISPTYFLTGDQVSVAKLGDFLLEYKDQIKVGVHLSAQRTLVENSGVSFRAAPTFWGYPLDVMDCHELCGIEVPLIGYSPKEQNAIIKTAVATLKTHIGQPIRHSLIEGGLFTKSVAARLRHNGIAVDHTLAGKTAADFYDIRHFPLYSWLEKIGTLDRVATRAATCVIKLSHPADGCRQGQPVTAVRQIYHSEAFLLTRGASILLSH